MKRIIAIVIIGIIALGIWALTWTNTSTYEYKIEEVKSVEVKPKLLKQLIPICACESTGNKNKTPVHFDPNGKVLLGKINPADTGMCQINIKIHAKELLKMGLDAFKESDNITFANWLYTNEGSTPWNWSKGCWQ